MASPFVAKAVRCTECFRHMVGSFGSAVPAPFRQQIRGKKKLARVVTINVHLLQNIPGYGRRGAVIPVTPGVMRNIWYPKKMAEYATTAKLQELGVKKDATIERDGAFATNRQRKLEKAQEPKEERPTTQTGAGKEPAEEVILELEQLSPQEATALLEGLLPANVDFYRTPITASQPAKRVSPSIPTTSTVSSAATAGQTPEKTSIYGSVSTSDIAANLKAILAENEKGARVPLAVEDISFVETSEDNQRIKHLGVYEIEIRLKGAPDAVRRTIKVNAQE